MNKREINYSNIDIQVMVDKMNKCAELRQLKLKQLQENLSEFINELFNKDV